MSPVSSPLRERIKVGDNQPHPQYDRKFKKWQKKEGFEPKERKVMDWLFYSALLVIAGLAVWAIIYYDIWSEVTNWVSDVASAVCDTVGWGILIIALALITVIVLVRIRKVLSIFRHAFKWLGAIAILFAAWGILAFFDLGGSFGLGIIGRRIFPVP
jgi:hypothetical protein